MLPLNPSAWWGSSDLLSSTVTENGFGRRDCQPAGSCGYRGVSALRLRHISLQSRWSLLSLLSDPADPCAANSCCCDQPASGPGDGCHGNPVITQRKSSVASCTPLFKAASLISCMMHNVLLLLAQLKNLSLHFFLFSLHFLLYSIVSC